MLSALVLEKSPCLLSAIGFILFIYVESINARRSVFPFINSGFYHTTGCVSCVMLPAATQATKSTRQAP